MRVVAIVLGWCLAGVVPASAQVTPSPAKVISSPGAASQGPVITFQPRTGVYGIAYREPGLDRFVGTFLDQDGNRTTGPIALTGDINGFEPSLRDVVAFPFSDAILGTFELYGHPDLFGSNVFVGDAGGIAFASDGLTSGVVNYTNPGGNDKLHANNCGQHEEIGVSAVDTITKRLFLSYNQLSHFYDNGVCRTSQSSLVFGFHQNAQPFNFSEGPFFVEIGASSQDAVFNPGTGHTWFGYASANQGPLKIARLTHTGIVQTVQVTPADGVFRFGLRLAVHPTSNNVLALWQVRDANLNITLMARLFAQDGQVLTPDIQLSDPNNPDQRVIRAFVAATADNFFVAGMLAHHVIGRVLTPAGAVASDWTQLDDLTDAFGNPISVNNGVDLVANPVRGTYALVVDSFSDIYFIEITASAGFPVTVTVDGTGAGLVTSNPPGIICPGACSMSVPPGTDVELFAQAANFSTFTGWSGVCDTAGACAFTVTAPAAATASFTRQQFAIAVTKVGDGTVTSSPAGIDCGATCSADFDGGSAVEFTAAASPGWRFDGWSGACSGSGACSVQVSAADSVTATFVQQVTLTVTAGGNGGGHIASNPAGIDCPGASCSITVDAGTLIELMASADATSRLSGWSGACAGAGACAITVSSDTTVEATFVRQFDVEVAIIGSGNVSSTPAGIACVGDCSGRFDTGADVVLTASAAAGWWFTGWSGDPACTGIGSCTLSSTDYRVASVTATFIPQPTYPLSVTRAGNGSGSVSSNPAGISCGSTCTADFDSGTMVTLTAAPGATSTFAGWSGACSGTGACVVTMTAAQLVTATFEAVSIASVSADVAALAPVIGSGPASSVTGKLTNAQASVARGNARAAANQLNAAINEIEALVRSRRLDEATGAALVADLQAIIGSF